MIQTSQYQILMILVKQIYINLLVCIKYFLEQHLFQLQSTLLLIPKDFLRPFSKISFYYYITKIQISGIQITSAMLKPNSKSKEHHTYFKSLSPRYPSSAVLLATQKQSEQKLLKKIHKLKHALKTAEKHNQELHAKIRIYRDGHRNQMHQMHAYDKQNCELHKEFEKKIKLLEKQNQSKSRQIAFVKEEDLKKTLKIKQLEEAVKVKQMKITQLQAINRDSSQALQKQKVVIKNLETAISSLKVKQIESSKIKSIEKELALKNAQNSELNREVSRLRESLRDSVYKNDKIALMTESHNTKSKLVEQDNKQLKKIITVYQKQSKTIHESLQKDKIEIQSLMQKISELQKGQVEAKFFKKSLEEAKISLEEKVIQLTTSLEEISAGNQILQEKYNAIILSNYELQRDFERQLHTIVKELTRRHIVSKSMINSVGSSIICGSPNKEQGRSLQHFASTDIH